MKTYYKKTWLLVVLSIFYFASQGQVTKSITFDETKGSKKIGTNKYQVTMIVDTVQKGNGLKFRLLVKNISGQISTIENPVSNFPFTLMDETGESVNIEEPNSKLVNQLKKPTKHESFDIEQIKINGNKSKSLNDTSTYVTLNPGETIETQLSIKKINKRKSPKPHTESQKVTISNGKYTLFATLIVMEAKEKSIVNPILFIGKPISILYK